MFNNKNKMQKTQQTTPLTDKAPNVIINIKPEKVQASNNEYYQTDFSEPKEDLKFGNDKTLLKGDKLSYLDETKDKLRYFKIVVGNRLFYGCLTPGAEKPKVAEYVSRLEYLRNEFILRNGEEAWNRFMDVYRSKKRAEKMIELEIIRHNAKEIESKLLK